MAKKKPLIVAIIVIVLVVSAVAAGVARLASSNPALTEKIKTTVQDPKTDTDSLNSQNPKSDSAGGETKGQEANNGLPDDAGTIGPQQPSGPIQTISTLYVVPEPSFAMVVLSILAAAAAFLVHNKTRRYRTV